MISIWSLSEILSIDFSVSRYCSLFVKAHVSHAVNTTVEEIGTSCFVMVWFQHILFRLERSPPGSYTPWDLIFHHLLYNHFLIEIDMAVYFDCEGRCRRIPPNKATISQSCREVHSIGGPMQLLSGTRTRKTTNQVGRFKKNIWSNMEENNGSTRRMELWIARRGAAPDYNTTTRAHDSHAKNPMLLVRVWVGSVPLGKRGTIYRQHRAIWIQV